MKIGLTHDEALDAITGTLGVTVLSYQEAVEGYLQLRRLTPLFTSHASVSFFDPQVTDAASVGRNPEGHDREAGHGAEHEHAVTPKAADAQ